MRFSLGCELGYEVESPTTFVLNVQPARMGRQRILREELAVTPDLPVETHVMPESGNRYVRLVARPGTTLRLAYDAEVELEVRREDPAGVRETPAAELPFATLPHLYPSRYCEADRLTRLAWQQFGRLEKGHGRVAAVCNWIHDQVEYRRGSSDEQTSATNTLLERAGVCRDFAHSGVALCRALGIPARFVSAYAWRLEPPDFHAVFEAYLGGRWYLFDATRQAALDGIVRIGIGRDAGEVSFATIMGAVRPTAMRVHIEPAGGGEGQDVRTIEAISTDDD